MRPADRGKYLFRIARLLQERAREFAVLESLDNGKPIRESRDVDIPLAAAHFFYHAGWADKLDHAGLGPGPRPLGVAGQVIPWNFPMLMLAWKIAPALATGNTVVLKPAETTPLTALLFAEVCQQADLPPGVVNIVTGAGETGRAVVEHGDVDKVAFTGSTEVGQVDRPRGRRHAQVADAWSSAARRPTSSSTTPRSTRPSRASCRASSSTRATSAAPGSRLLVQENVHDEVIASLQRRISTLRVGDPLDKNTDLGAINSAEQLARIRELSDIGDAEGAQRWQPDCVLPDRGFWFPPTVFTEVSPAHRIARDEVFGPVLSVMTFRTPDEAVAKANNTTYGLSAGIWTEKGSRILKIAEPAPRRRGVGQHVQQVRPDVALRRLQAVRLRPRGRPARADRLPEGCDALMSDRLAVRKTYKLYVNGAFPRSESGRTYEVTDPSGHFLANAAWASRKDARDAVVAARGAFGKWSAMTAYNRGQVLYRVAEVMEGRHAQFCEEVGRRRGALGVQGPRRRGRRHRPVGLVRRVDRQARRRPRRGQPGRRAVLRLLDARADRRRRRPGAAAVVAARPGQRARAGEEALAAFEDLVEHGCGICHRAADHLQHFGRCRLLLERFLRLAKQSCILDRDDRLVSERLEQFHMDVGYRPGPSPSDSDDADGTCIAQHGYAKHAPPASCNRHVSRVLLVG